MHVLFRPNRESNLRSSFMNGCPEAFGFLNQSTMLDWFRNPKASRHPFINEQMADGARHVHRRAAIFTVSTKQLMMVMKGLSAEHIMKHGAESPLPTKFRRKFACEPLIRKKSQKNAQAPSWHGLSPKKPRIPRFFLAKCPNRPMHSKLELMQSHLTQGANAAR